jgi:hypothetical protein
MILVLVHAFAFASVYLASIANWEIFSATPISSGLAPMLKAVPKPAILADPFSALYRSASL